MSRRTMPRSLFSADMAANADNARAAPGAAGGAMLLGLPVLIVDPDPASAGRTERALAGAGCTTRVAHDAEEALAVLHDYRPRIILLDLILPGMSGLVLAQALTVDSGRWDVAIIAVTAFTDAGTERMAREAGCVTHLRRPVHPSRLLKVIVAQLRGDA
jgi:two-component system response regulator MtrA